MMTAYNEVLARKTDKAPQGMGASSQTVAFSHYNHLSAQLPLDPKTGKVVTGDLAGQAEQCLKNVKAVVESIDHVMTDVVNMTVYLKDMMDLDAFDRAYAAFFPVYKPARTVVAVQDLPLGADVQVEALLSNGEGTIPNAPQAGDLVKLTNQCDQAPKDGFSSQTVAFSHYNHLSAQLPIDPVSNRILAEDVAGQASQCLSNIKGILSSIDVPMDDIVRINLYVTNLDDLETIDGVYARFFPDSAIARAVAYLPARTVIPVKDLPMGALVQMEAVVSYGDGTPPQAIEDRHGLIIEANNTKAAPLCPLSTQTVAFSHYNHLSALLPLELSSDKLVSSEVKDQAAQCLSYMKAIVESIDHSLKDVVNVRIYLTDLKDLAQVDKAYADFFPAGVPTRTVVGVANLPYGAKVQMDAVVGNEEGTPPIR